MDKYRPETKQAKKERLRERAAARSGSGICFKTDLLCPIFPGLIEQLGLVPLCQSAGAQQTASGRFTQLLDELWVFETGGTKPLGLASSPHLLPCLTSLHQVRGQGGRTHQEGGRGQARRQHRHHPHREEEGAARGHR